MLDAIFQRHMIIIRFKKYHFTRKSSPIDFESNRNVFFFCSNSAIDIVVTSKQYALLATLNQTEALHVHPKICVLSISSVPLLLLLIFFSVCTYSKSNTNNSTHNDHWHWIYVSNFPPYF